MATFLLESMTIGQQLAALGAVFVISICTLFAYRLTLHPYSKYPGPFLARVTSLYSTYHAYVGDIHLDIERCHGKYGNLVRYRPDAVLVGSCKGYHDIYGNLRPVKKANSYDVHGPGNVIGIQDKREHAAMKKILQQGFSDSALRKYEPSIVQGIETYCEKLLETDSPFGGTDGWTKPKDINSWSNYLTTDVISVVVFGVSWNLLTSPENRDVRGCLVTVLQLTGILHHNWVLRLHNFLVLACLPHLGWSIKGLRKHTMAMIKSANELLKTDPTASSYFGYFSNFKNPNTGEPYMDERTIRINSSNLIIAGSDTTSSSMAATFYYLSRDPKWYRLVADEVRTTFSSPDEIRTGAKLSSCVHLKAAINEAMRMCPVAAQPLWRTAEAPQGCVVDGEHFPPGSTVGATIYHLHRHPDVFPDPYRFDPGRWMMVQAADGDTEDSKAVVEAEKERLRELTRFLVPFSAGPRQCLAKNFAMLELILAIAHVVWRMDFRRPDGAAGRVGETEEGKGKDGLEIPEMRFKSYFTSYLEGPMVEFKKRQI